MAKTASGITVPIAAFAPVERPAGAGVEVEDGEDVEEEEAEVVVEAVFDAGLVVEEEVDRSLL
jgi:hypothetical protein